MTAAKVLLTILVLIQGAATVLIDFNRTHATNPSWAGHARFHLVWQTCSLAILSLIETGLVWSDVNGNGHFYLAAALAAVSLVGFLCAQLGRTIYGGTLSDPNGIPPLRVHVGTRIVDIDGNAAAVYCAIPVLIFIVALFHSASHHA